MSIPSPTHRSSLGIRATLWILAVVGLVGAVSYGLGHTLANQREEARTQAQLKELLDTVERTVSIACFLKEQQLATEVSQGLLSSRIVSHVVIRAGETELARADRGSGAAADQPRPSPADIIVRKIQSPFDPKEEVGEIHLAPDPAEIWRRATSASTFIGLMLILQTVVVALAVLFVVYRLITHPIRQMSDELSRLPAETGQTLSYPRRHEYDELGGLVNYINWMIVRLVTHIQVERDLRLERGIEERRFRAIFENADTAIFLIDHRGNIISHNQAYLDIMRAAGQGNAESLSLVTNVFDSNEARFIAALEICLREGKNIMRDIQIRGRDGKPDRWIDLTLSVIQDVVFQGVANDVTHRKLTEFRTRRLAMTDALTRLLNRFGFESRLRERIYRLSLQPEDWVALVLIDLDFFKEVNDTHGHDAGDQVLRHFGALLRQVARRSDLVGRVGGDEFELFLDGLNDPKILDRLALKIIGMTAIPIDIGLERTVRIGASIGIAVTQGNAIDQDILSKRADEAMYEAKRRGRNTYVIWQPEISRSRPAATTNALALAGNASGRQSSGSVEGDMLESGV